MARSIKKGPYVFHKLLDKIAKAKASNKKLAGIALIVLGIGLLIWGFQMSGSFGNQLSQSFTGSATDAVMLRYIGGAVSLAVGIFLLRR